MDHGPWTTDHGPRTMDHGPRTMDHGPRTADYNPMYALTRGSILSGVQNGCQTRLIVTSPTPAIARTARSTSPMICGPAGQPGDVNVMSTCTSLPSTTMS